MTKKAAKNKSKEKKERLKPISLYPLEVEEATEALLNTRPPSKLLSAKREKNKKI